MIIANMFLIFNQRMEKKVKGRLLKQKKFKKFYKNLTQDKYSDYLSISKERIKCQKASLVMNEQLLDEPEFSKSISERNYQVINYLNSDLQMLIMFSINLITISMLITHTWIEGASLQNPNTIILMIQIFCVFILLLDIITRCIYMGKSMIKSKFVIFELVTLVCAFVSQFIVFWIQSN